jgi:hypothetical protein
VVGISLGRTERLYGACRWYERWMMFWKPQIDMVQSSTAHARTHLSDFERLICLLLLLATVRSCDDIGEDGGDRDACQYRAEGDERNLSAHSHLCHWSRAMSADPSTKKLIINATKAKTVVISATIVASLREWRLACRKNSTRPRNPDTTVETKRQIRTSSLSFIWFLLSSNSIVKCPSHPFAQ